MEIEATVQVDYTMYKHFHYFSLFRKKDRNKSFLILMIMIPILFLLSAQLYVYNPENPVWVMGFTCVFFAVIFLIMKIFYAPKKYYRSVEKLLSIPYSVSFSEEKFENRQISTTATGSGSYQYDMIHKAYEEKDIFYIFITKRQAFLIPKTALTKGTPAGLRKLLQEKLGAKFVLCYKE